MHKRFFDFNCVWHIGCSLFFQQERKEVNQMKNTKALLAALLLAGSFVATSTASASDGTISKDVLTPGSYCHEKFPAIQARSLAARGRSPFFTGCIASTRVGDTGS